MLGTVMVSSNTLSGMNVEESSRADVTVPFLSGLKSAVILGLGTPDWVRLVCHWTAVLGPWGMWGSAAGPRFLLARGKMEAKV